MLMDLTSISTIKDIQNKFGFSFSKSLGQNFLTSGDVLKKISEAAGGSDAIIEIGPGFGVLTRELCANYKKVVSIEIDKSLPQILKYTLSDFDNFKLINNDVLKMDMIKLIAEEFGDAHVSVCANLPYYITTPILTSLLEQKLPLDNIVIMVQKEVAKRLVANPSCKDYGAITLLCKYYGNVDIICDVPRTCFVPSPNVDSSVVRIKLTDKPTVDIKNEKMFFKTVKAAFSQRRKTLLNCLSGAFSYTKDDLKQILNNAKIDEKRRGETLSIQEFAKLSDFFYEKNNLTK